MLHFQASFGSAIDVTSNIRIHQPRIQKGPSPDDVEFDYAIYQGATRDGLACGGTCTHSGDHEKPIRLFKIDLGDPSVVGAMLKLKDRLCIEGDNFEYIYQLARGLMLVFQSRTDNAEEVLYVVSASPSSLLARAIVPPIAFPKLPNGDLLLADLRLEARGFGAPCR